MSCSIVIPTYNRKKFEKLMEFNIKSQTYKNIIEVVIGDDGLDSQRLELNIPYPIVYLRCPRMSIGEKRNLLAKTAKGDYIAHMDSDDLYFPQYIESSIQLMKDKGMNDVLLTGGGIIPEDDMAQLQAMGVGKLFAPGATTTEIADYIKDWVAANRNF